MATKTEINVVFRQDGSVARQQVTTTDITIPDTLIDRLAVANDRRYKSVFAIDNRPVHLTMSGRLAYYTLRLNVIPLKCPFKAVSGVMVPMLASETAPVIPQEWVIPDDLKTFLLFQTNWQQEYNCTRLDKVWLFTFDSAGIMWRLPLGNLYDDAAVCTGLDGYTGLSGFDVVKSCYDQFVRSVWNSDLWRDVERTQAMFRFQPHNTGFTQLPPDGSYTELCRKISVSISTKGIYV